MQERQGGSAAQFARPSRALTARVRRFIVDRALIAPGDRVLGAVSGGADSTCLLLVLAELRRSLKFELQAAYFDHMLRGRRAVARDKRAVTKLCEQLNVPLHLGAADVGAHKRARGLSPEEAARELRYAFLARTAHEHECASVATGHTENDQAETVLLHIIRGSGMRGLAAMAPDAPMPVRDAGMRLIRPLLAVGRAETEACCRACGVEPIEDRTNRSNAYQRNRVRHEVLPLLRTLNPRIEQALVRLSAAAAEDEARDREGVSIALDDAVAKNRTLRISRRTLAALPERARASFVRGAIERVLGDTRSIAERHVLAIMRSSDTTGARLDLPRRLRVEVQRQHVVLRAGEESKRVAPRRVHLTVPGSVRFGAFSVRAELLPKPPTRRRLERGVSSALLDADALGARVWLRSRRPGDRYQPVGRTRPKKLQDVLVDAHVPRSERDGLPLICCRRGIAWVAGQPPAEWAKVGPGTKQVVRIRAVRAEA